MVTVLQIITEAYRESNNIPIGTVPTTAEQAEGLLLFNRYTRSVYGNEMGDPLTPLAIGNNNVNQSSYYNYITVPTNGWYAPMNSRIICNNQSAITINFNPYPIDGERLAIQDASNNFSTYPVTLIGNGRTIGGAITLVLSTSGIRQEYFYRADTNDWVLVSDLQLSDIFPFPEEFEDFFIIGVALRVNPRNKQTLDPQSAQAYQRMRTLFRARYGQTTEVRSEEGLIRTSNVTTQKYRSYNTYLNTGQRFNAGYSN